MSLKGALEIGIKYWPMFIRGAYMTLVISIISTILGATIGLIIGIIRTIPDQEKGFKKTVMKVVNGLLSAYIELFRGTPMMVQSAVFYYGVAAAYGIQLNRTFAAILIVSVNTGAYMAEIVRGGIVSIDKGQFEAAHALGMNHVKTMTNVVLPQVIRNILPATGNEFVVNIKDTSVLNIIGVTELFFQSRSIVGANFKYFETYFVAGAIYFVMTFTVTRILRAIEKRLDGPKNYNIIGNQMQVMRAEDLKDRQ